MPFSNVFFYFRDSSRMAIANQLKLLIGPNNIGFMKNPLERKSIVFNKSSFDEMNGTIYRADLGIDSN